jgi:hypothetical protein
MEPNKMLVELFGGIMVRLAIVAAIGAVSTFAWIIYGLVHLIRYIVT